MRKVNYLQGLLLLALMATMNGCVSIFATRYQKVSVVSTTPGASVKLYSDTTTAADSMKPRLDKYKQLYGVTVSKPGYKSRNYCFGLNKYAPAAALGFVDLAFLGATGVIVGATADNKAQGYIYTAAYGFVFIATDMHNAKARRYDAVQKVPELLPIVQRKKGEKYFEMGKLTIDSSYHAISSADFKGMNRYKKYLDGAYSVADNPGEVPARRFYGTRYNVEKSAFTYGIFEALKKMDFIDTEHIVLGDASNSFVINANVAKITLNRVYSHFGGSLRKREHTVAKNEALSVETVIEWRICDHNGELIDSIITEKVSDLFIYDPDKSNTSEGKCYDLALNDNLEYALMDVRQHLENKNLLIGGEKKDTTAEIEIPVPASTTNIADVKNAAVMIKVGDYLGSGAVLSADGYIVTSYSLIKDADKITVVFNDSSKVDAKLVRRSGLTDMALLKVEKTGLHPLKFSADTDPEIGTDATIVGGSRSEEIGIGLSKGILSGIRKSGTTRVLQTDASLNPASIGAALVDQHHEVLGIVSDKLMGHGVEGIGFAVLSADVFSSLHLHYKK